MPTKAPILPIVRLNKPLLAARAKGFTLTELTIVLVIVALLIGGMLMPLATQRDIRANTETSQQLDEIRDALLGFAIVNGYFPCPAVSPSDGNENRDSTTKKCKDSKRKGLLPWVTLGTRSSDAWGHLFLYSVTPAFSDSGTHFTLSTPSDITIQTRDLAGNIANLSNVKDIPVVVISTGKNAYWSWTINSATQNADSSNPNDDEDTNSAPPATGVTFISRTPSNLNSSLGEFDDIVTWISPNILFNRMISAGRLP